MMRRFLTVSTLAVLSNFGIMNLAQAGLFKQAHPLAALPKHNIIVAQAEIPADPIYANMPAAPASTDTPPLPTFAVTPTTTTTADTPTLSTAPENSAPTITAPAENLTTIPGPTEEVLTPTPQKEIEPTNPPRQDPVPLMSSPEQISGSSSREAQEPKLLPAPTKTPVKTKKIKTLPTPSNLPIKHQQKSGMHKAHHHLSFDEPKGLRAFTKYPLLIPAPHYKPSNELQPLIPFKGIAADGNIRVFVESGSSRSVQILNKGYSGDKLVRTDVSRGVLVLHDVSRDNFEEQAPRIIKVKVVAPHLASIHLSGNACLSAKNLPYSIVDIDAATSGYLKIRGNICLHHILQRGRGPIDIEWANSDHIKIIGTNSGPIHIAGRTDILNIRARDHADIDTKFLRANSGLIQTSENATVAVTVVDALSGFATGISNIFYYKTPKHLTRHTYDLANVIQMNYWN